VGSIEIVNGQQYFRLQFFERELLVRQTEDGSILALNRDTNAEVTWLPLGAEPGQSMQTSFDACSRTATVQSRNAKLQTELGNFDNALEIRYVPNCADAGTTVQYFLPYVGLVHYESTSIAGPVVHDLIYSRTGFTNIDTKVNAFTLATDSAVYPVGEAKEGLARLTLRVSDPIKLTFPSGQSTDLRVTNEKGETAYMWSADKLFSQVVREEQIGPGDKTWVMSSPVGQLPVGKYKIEGWLTTNPLLYSGYISFEVKQFAEPAR